MSRKDNITKNSDELSGQYILQNVSCECFFKDYEFSVNQLWVFPIKNLIVSKGNEYDGVYISSPNKPEEYILIDGVLTLTDSNKEYVVNFNDDKVTLTFIDDPLITDDERWKIVYYISELQNKAKN